MQNMLIMTKRQSAAMNSNTLHQLLLILIMADVHSNLEIGKTVHVEP